MPNVPVIKGMRPLSLVRGRWRGRLQLCPDLDTLSLRLS